MLIREEESGPVIGTETFTWKVVPDDGSWDVHINPRTDIFRGGYAFFQENEPIVFDLDFSTDAPGTEFLCDVEPADTFEVPQGVPCDSPYEWPGPGHELPWDLFVWAVRDGITGPASVQWFYVNTLPEIEPLRDQEHVVGTELKPIPISVDDWESTATLTAVDLPPGVRLDGETLVGTLQEVGVYEVSIEADDGDGGTAREAFVWRVIEPPEGPEMPPPPPEGPDMPPPPESGTVLSASRSGGTDLLTWVEGAMRRLLR